jgi:hypothetical protein
MSFRMPAAQGERDANHQEIVDAYEACLCSVQDLSAVGFGCPDLNVGCGGEFGANDYVEIKTDHGRLSKSQERWIRDWRGPKPRIIRTVDEAIAHAQELRRRAVMAARRVPRVTAMEASHATE